MISSNLVWLNKNSEQKLWLPPVQEWTPPVQTRRSPSRNYGCLLYKNGLPQSKRRDLSRDLDHAGSFLGQEGLRL